MLLETMTFNLRFASDTPPHSWPERRPVVAECLRQCAPDLIGTQEGLWPQIHDIAADRPEFGWIGKGREGGTLGESVTVFYRQERLQPLEHGFFWLSDTPEVIASKSWGNRLTRITTWIKFRDLPSGHEFYFWDTHLDHESQNSREKGAALICSRISALNTDLPVILVGDFNAVARANRAYDIFMEAGFTDARFCAKQNLGPHLDSYHGYAPPVPGGAHIDWILTRGPIQSHTARLVDFHQNGQYPSDHFPLMTTLELKE